MSGFVSSAVGGKQAAPKAAARRRPATAAKPTAPSTCTAEQIVEVPLLPTPDPTQSETTSSVEHDQHAAVTAHTISVEAGETASASGAEEEDRDTSDRTQPEKSPPGTNSEPTPLFIPSASVQVPAAQRSPTSAGAKIAKKRHHDAAPSQPIVRPAKKQKKSSTRTNATIQSQINEDDFASTPSPPQPQQSKQHTSGRLSQPAAKVTRGKTKDNSGAHSPVSGDSALQRQRGVRFKSAATTIDSDDESEALNVELEEGSADDEERIGNVKTQKQRRGGPQKRKTKTSGKDSVNSGTEEGPEESDSELREIDPSTISMFELSHKARYGKVSQREQEMAGIDWDEVARKRREAVERIIAGEQQSNTDVVETTEGPDGTATGTPSAAEDETAPDEADQAEAGAEAVPTGGVQFRMVNGQIVEDESTLAIDRQAEAEANALNADVVEEENDLTVRHNRTTWVNDRRRDPTERIPMSMSKGGAWSEEDTEAFYEAIRMFGTDFFTISQMFPRRTRKHIKAKFNREERIDPARIKQSLLGKHTRKWDLSYYAKLTGQDVGEYTKYENFEQAEAAIKESMKEKEEAMQQAVKEQEENERQEGIQREQRKAAQEKKKANRKNRKKSQGAGTLGGGQDGNDEGGEV